MVNTQASAEELRGARIYLVRKKSDWGKVSGRGLQKKKEKRREGFNINNQNTSRGGGDVS